MVYKQPKSKNWWYKFTWRGELIRMSTKQANKRVAEQIDHTGQNKEEPKQDFQKQAAANGFWAAVEIEPQTEHMIGDAPIRTLEFQ